MYYRNFIKQDDRNQVIVRPSCLYICYGRCNVPKLNRKEIIFKKPGIYN